MKRSPFLQRIFLPFALLAMVVAVLSGLNRLGLHLPFADTASQHGGMMTGSFLGTLILLERAVVHHSRIALFGPLLNLLSLPFFLAGENFIAVGLLVAGGLSMVIIFYQLSLKSPSLEQHVLTAGAIMYTCGSLMLLLTGLYPKAFPFWIGFFLLVITGERLELSRFLDISQKIKNVLVILLSLVAVGAFLPFHGTGKLLLAVGLAGTAIWLLRFDMARISIRKKGQFRFTGASLICGYCWLLVSAVLLWFWDVFPFGYDAALHTFFLGFVFSMIFAHAPIILPAVAKIQGGAFHWSLYIWLFLLQLSLALRVFADVSEPILRPWAASINGIAITVFFINLALVFAFSKRPGN